MLNEFKKSKLERFTNDKDTFDAVYDVLLATFLKERPGQDVYVLAAARLSVDYLNQAWREIEKYRSDNPVGEKSVTNIGL